MGTVCVSEYRENVEHGKETQYDGSSDCLVYNKVYSKGKLIEQNRIISTRRKDEWGYVLIKPFYARSGVIANAANRELW